MPLSRLPSNRFHRKGATAKCHVHRFRCGSAIAGRDSANTTAAYSTRWLTCSWRPANTPRLVTNSYRFRRCRRCRAEYHRYPPRCITARRRFTRRLAAFIKSPAAPLSPKWRVQWLRYPPRWAAPFRDTQSPFPVISALFLHTQPPSNSRRYQQCNHPPRTVRRRFRTMPVSTS